MPRLANKVALITGGGTGIGRACALLFAREGAKVAICGRRSEPLEAVVKEIATAGGTALAVVCDVTEEAAAAQAVRQTAERFRGLHVVVNNAGALKVATVEGTTLAEWNHLLAVNLTGTFLVSRAAVPELRKAGGGSIVNIGSLLGLYAMKQRAAYAASKGGVTMLTKAMALDHAADGIRINCICPTVVETDLMKSVFSKAPDPDAARKARAAIIPLGRIGQPEDVANMALYFASDESSWVTGLAVPIDGGVSAF